MNRTQRLENPIVYRSERRNVMRKDKAFSRQKRDREFPNYQPYENDGGGMTRNYERAAQKEADEALAKVAEQGTTDGSN
jgi:hypothetical protein